MAELDRQELLALWRRMVRIRHFERRVSEIAAANAVDGYLHTYAGQEAVACGVIPLLRDDDWFTSTYRNHGHAIARGIPLEAIAAELYGRATGVCQGKGGSMHVADQHRGMIGGMGIVAGGLPIATGAAFAASYLGQHRVAIAFFGDGAVHQGAWHEALDFAGLFRCPVIFVCENNLYAETTAVDYHLLADSVAAMTANYRIPSVQVDGMDVFAVRDSAAEAIDRARAGGGPALIEALTYRYGGQYEGDTQTYKPPAEVTLWQGRDPLPRFRTTVTYRGLLGSDELDAVDAEAAAEVDAAFAAAEAAPWPDISLVTADVYTTS
ncbi:MAG: thiamine pyrophosphate-dependent dehydrogenase E1 component subunit alpha [Acidimicrobiales bacterium]